MARKKPQIIFLYLMLPAIFIIFIYSLIFAKFSNISQPYTKFHQEQESIVDIRTAAILLPSSSPENIEESKKSIINTGKEYSKILKSSGNDTRVWDDEMEKRFQTESKRFPLKVIIVPHSHNDPGWLNTYDQYFYHYTFYILENMVKNLNKYPNMTFVWAEMSFFSRWWNSLTSTKMKENLRKLLAEKRLEIVTGAWVMTDEGPAHYFNMIDQLVEGHQFLRTNLKYQRPPTNAWSVDPFGHSSTFGYLLKKSGIENIYIQRTHYAWKKYLSIKRYLEFFWKQPFQNDDDDYGRFPLCHMSPLHLYSYKYGCGPDHQVCLEYDFRKISGEHSESTAIPLNRTNIDSKARKILKQYGKLGSLFPHNVALVLLGDDFRYNFDIEWQQQYRNYMFLMDYINSNRNEFNDSHIQFGTMEDYFRAVDERIPIQKGNYPTIEGDFMPYADSYVEPRPNYWTGYFTTRPYFKYLDRILQHWLRSTEIVYTLTRNHVRQHGKDSIFLKSSLERDYNVLSEARQNLALFQHHDGITGTSKDYVMEDYGRRLGHSINVTMLMFARLIQYLNFNERSGSIRNNSRQFIFPIEDKPDWIRVTERKILKIPSDPEGLKILAFNSLTQTRTESIRILSDDPFVQIYDIETNQKIPYQINPVFDGPSALSSNVFEIEFFDQLPPLSLKNYRISSNEESLESKVTIVLMDEDSSGNENKLDQSNEAFLFEQNRGIHLENDFMRLTFDTKGFLEKIHFKRRNVTEYVRMYFLAYTPVPKRSGAYLLKFDKRIPERMLFVTGEITPTIHLVQGQFSSTIMVNYTDIAYTVKLYNGNDDDHDEGGSANGIELKLLIDLQNKPQYDDQEIALRIETGIENRRQQQQQSSVNESSYRTFYVDSNGFQIFERRYVNEIGIEGNYYPMTSSLFIEDDRRRFTVLASHSHGATSPKDGAVEIMLDRRITLDDKRGLSEGIMDNLPVESSFWLIFEESMTYEKPKSNLPVLTELAEHLLARLNYPVSILYSYRNEQEIDDHNGPYYRNRYLISPHTPLCRYFLLNLRTLPFEGNFSRSSSSSLMILHHRASRPSTMFRVKNCDIGQQQNNHGAEHHHRHHHYHHHVDSVIHLFNEIRINTVQPVTLTGLEPVKSPTETIINSIDDLAVPPFEIVSFNVTFL